MTVKEFITQHPGGTFDMTTPSGFVYLLPEEASAMLAGNSIKGNPGMPGAEFERPIDAEWLLTQVVLSPYFKDGVWHFTTTY